MSRTITSSRQIVKRTLLDIIASKSGYSGTADAKPANSTELDNLLEAINKELQPSIYMAESTTPDLVVNLSSNSIQNPETLKKRTSSGNQTFASGTITLPAASGGNITVSAGSPVALTISNNNFRKILVEIADNDDIVLTLGTEGASEAAATLPTNNAGNTTIGYIVAQADGAGNIANIINAFIYQFTSPVKFPKEVLDYIGLSDLDTSFPTYTSNIRGTANEDLTDRIGVLTHALGDSQEDRSAYIRSNNEVSWTGTQLEFTTDIVLEILNTKSGTATLHNVQTASSPITIADGESVWVSIDRTAASENLTINKTGTTAIPAQTQANKDVFILFKRIDVNGSAFLHMPFMKQLIQPGNSVRLGASGVGGSGQGGINYITNSQFETNIDDWSHYDDGTTATPVDGTGEAGATDLSIARTTTASEILRGEASLKISKAAADAQGEGFSTPFIIDPKDKEKDLIINFDYKMLDTNYASGDFIIYVYDIDNATLIGKVRNDQDGELLFHGGEGTTFKAVFSATDSLNYRLIFHVASTNATAYDFVIDNVSVGPDKSVPVNIIQALTDTGQTLTSLVTATTTNPTFPSSGINVNKVLQGRNGDRGLFKYEYRQTGNTGAASGSGDFLYQLPNGLSFDSTKTEFYTGVEGVGNFEQQGSVIGTFTATNSTGSDPVVGVVVPYDTTKFRLFGSRHSNAGVIGSAYFSPGDAGISWMIDITSAFIEGWSATSQVSTTENTFKNAKAVGYASNSTTNASFADQTFEIIDFDVTQEDTVNGVTTGASWQYKIQRDDTYDIKCKVHVTTAGGDNSSLILSVFVNGIERRRSDVSTDANGDGVDLSCLIPLSKGDLVDFRLRQDTISNAARTLTTSSEIWSNYSIHSVRDTSVFSVTGETEYREAQDTGVNTQASPAAGTWYQPASTWQLVVPPGIWDLEVSGPVQFVASSGTVTGFVALGTSATPGTDIIRSFVVGNFDTTQTNPMYSYTHTVKDFTVTETTTFYVNTRYIAFTGGATASSLSLRNNLGGPGVLLARRVK